MAIEISIRGQRGVGKSVLARHLAEYLRDKGHDVTVGFTVDRAHSNCDIKHSIHITEEWMKVS